MHTFPNVSHKGILSDADSVARVLEIINRYGKISSDSGEPRQSARRELPDNASRKRPALFSFLKFAGEPFRRWNFTTPHAESA